MIAIENVRLFDEVQARTRELARSVEELRALGEVSHAVNSTLDLETVLSTIVAKAVQLSADGGRRDLRVQQASPEIPPPSHLRHERGDDRRISKSRALGSANPTLAKLLTARDALQVADLMTEPPRRYAISS